MNKTINKTIRKIHLKTFMKIPFVFALENIRNDHSRKILAWMSYLFQRNFQNYKNDFIPLPSNTLRNMFGNQYKRGLDELMRNELVERKCLLDAYGENYYSIKDGVCASYRLSRECLEKIRLECFSFFPIDLDVTLPRPRTGKWKLASRCPQNEKNLKILEAYRGISIDSKWIEYFQSNAIHPPNHHKYPNEPVSQYGMFLHCWNLIQSIYNKTIGITTDSKCGRAFHPLIEMARVIRQFIKKDGKDLVVIDAESFHPYLVASCIESIQNREKYLRYVRNNFYERFVDSRYSREKVKASYQKYLAGKSTDTKAKEIQIWYESEFPEVSAKMVELHSNKMSFQMYLQQMESSIFVDAVFMKAPFFCLPMHDGLAVECPRNLIQVL